MVVYLVVERAFVSITYGNTLVRSVKVAPSVSITYRNTGVRSVKLAPSVSITYRNIGVGSVKLAPSANMASKNTYVYIVMVESCAKPHIALPIKIESMMDTVCFALSICFRIRLLHGTI